MLSALTFIINPTISLISKIHHKFKKIVHQKHLIITQRKEVAETILHWIVEALLASFLFHCPSPVYIIFHNISTSFQPHNIEGGKKKRKCEKKQKKKQWYL